MSDKERILRFLEQTYLNGESGLSPEENLFESGILDSLAFLNLVSFLEREFSLSLQGNELDVRHFSTVNAMVHLLQEHSSPT